MRKKSIRGLLCLLMLVVTGRLRSLQRVRWKWQFIEESKGEKI